MDCERIEPELIGFHFGALDDEARRAVEVHLVACSACLRAFLETKRALEQGAEEVPSEASRQRLRAAASLELARRRRTAPRPLSRRAALPLAVAAALVLALFVGAALSRRGSPAPDARIEAVDAIHSAPTSLDVL